MDAVIFLIGLVVGSMSVIAGVALGLRCRAIEITRQPSRKLKKAVRAEVEAILPPRVREMLWVAERGYSDQGRG